VLEWKADPRSHRRSGVLQWQIERERAAFARRTLKMNFAAQQARKLTADREPKPSAAIFSAGPGVGLLKRLKDQLLLFQRDANAGVGHFEGDHGRRLIETGMLGAPAPDRSQDVEAHPALGGELERV